MYSLDNTTSDETASALAFKALRTERSNYKAAVGLL